VTEMANQRRTTSGTTSGNILKPEPINSAISSVTNLDQLKEHFQRIWDQVLVKSRREFQDVEEKRAFWQHRIAGEVSKAAEAAAETAQELANLRADVQSLARLLEPQNGPSVPTVGGVGVAAAAASATTVLPQETPEQQLILPSVIGRTSAQSPSMGESAASLGSSASKSEAGVDSRRLGELVDASVKQSEQKLAELIDEMTRIQVTRIEEIRHLIADVRNCNQRFLTELNVKKSCNLEQSSNTSTAACDFFEPTEAKLVPALSKSTFPAKKDVSNSKTPVQDPLLEFGKMSPKEEGPRKASGAMESLQSVSMNYAVGDAADDAHLEANVLSFDDLLSAKRDESPVDACLRYLQHASFVLVVSNTAYMGLDLDISSPYLLRQEEPPTWLKAGEMVFTVLFCLELILRAFLEKVRFLRGPNACWNIFDTIIVVFQVFESMHNMRNAGFLRILRILRVARTARAIKSLKSLRTGKLIMAPEVWQPLCWGCAMLVSLLYIFSLILTAAATDNGASVKEDQRHPRLLELYGSVGSTMNTLFAAITGGEPWYDLARPLTAFSDSHHVVFVLFMFLMSFGVINTIAAVYVDGLIHYSNVEREFSMAEASGNDKRHLKHIRDLLLAAGTSKGNIRYCQLLEVLSGESCPRELRSLGLESGVAVSLFKLLDTDNKKVVEVDQFIHGLLHVKGNAAHIHLATLLYQGRQQLSKLQELVTDVQDKVIPLAAGVEPSLILGHVQGKEPRQNGPWSC